jgi:uncharacterized protein YecE (DUF72 family)
LLRARHEGPVVCEPRHVTWAAPAAQRLLTRFRVARVAADPPRAAGFGAPGGWPGLVYFRWHGSPRTYFSSYTPERIDHLAVELLGAGVTAWCIFDNTGSGSAAANALDLRARLVERRGPNSTGEHG